MLSACAHLSGYGGAGYSAPVTSVSGLASWCRRRAPWSPLVLFTGAFVFLLVTMNRTLDVYDEGIIVYGAARVEGGAIPYRDFWSLYGPGQYYVLAGLFHIFGSSVLVERSWDLAVRAAISIFVFSQVNRLASRWCGIGAFVVAVLWLGDYQFYGFPVFPALLFTGASAYLLTEYVRRTRERAVLLLSGLSVGLATLFRHDLGFLTALTGALLLFGRRLATQPASISWSRRFGVAARELMPYVFGIGVILVPTVTALVLAVPLDDLLFPLIVYPSTVYPRVRALPFPGFPDPILVLRGVKDVGWLAHGVGIYFPVLVSVMALGVLLGGRLTWARKRALSTDEWPTLLYAILVPAVYLKGLIRISPLHLAPAFILAVILFFTLLYRVLGQFRLTRRVVILLSVLVMGLPVVKPLAYRVASNFDLSIRRGPLRRLHDIPATLRAACHPPHGLERARCLSVDPTQALAVDYVLEHLPADQRIYVGNWRHDRIFVSDAMFYFLVDRAAPTKYFDLIPGLQTTRPIQERLIRDLVDHDVRLVVLCSRWEDVHELNDSSRSSGVTLLDGYIRDHYRLVMRFGDYTIWERTSPIAAARGSAAPHRIQLAQGHHDEAPRHAERPGQAARHGRERDAVLG